MPRITWYHVFGSDAYDAALAGMEAYHGTYNSLEAAKIVFAARPYDAGWIVVQGRDGRLETVTSYTHNDGKGRWHGGWLDERMVALCAELRARGHVAVPLTERLLHVATTEAMQLVVCLHDGTVTLARIDPGADRRGDEPSLTPLLDHLGISYPHPPAAGWEWLKREGIAQTGFLRVVERASRKAQAQV
jgi:hypothetical protein